MARWFSKNRPSADPEPAARQIDEEFAFHLDSAERDGRDAGLAEDDARAQARAAFGDVSHHRDACLRVAQPWSSIMCSTAGKWAFATTGLAIGFVLGVLVPSILDDAIDAFTDTQWKRIGAFEGVVWREDRPVVLVDSRWYVLDAINGRPIDAFLDATEDHFGDRTRKRFKEDLYEVLVALGEPGTAIAATLRDPETGEVVEKTGIELTKDKRDHAYSDDWRQREDVPPPPTPGLAQWWGVSDAVEGVPAYGC